MPTPKPPVPFSLPSHVLHSKLSDHGLLPGDQRITADAAAPSLLTRGGDEHPPSRQATLGLQSNCMPHVGALRPQVQYMQEPPPRMFFPAERAHSRLLQTREVVCGILLLVLKAALLFDIKAIEFQL